MGSVNNSETFKDIFQSNYPGLVAFARKFIVDQETARDIVQEVFCYLWDNKDSIEIDHSITSYLFKSVKNKCLNQLRKSESHNSYINDFLIKHNTGIATDTDSGHQILIGKELSEEVNHAVNSLPTQCRQIFKSSKFEGKKNKEIADQQGISVRTVETQLYRAMRIMKTRLASFL
jgi:RNA polymerase sigma-70 factor (ECF subfamily)